MMYNFISTLLRFKYAVYQVFESTRADYFTGLIQNLIVQIHELSKKYKLLSTKTNKNPFMIRFK